MANYYYQGNKPYYGDDTRIQVPQGPESFTEGSKPIRWNWCAHTWSVFSVLFCWWCIIAECFGFCGLVCALSSYTDYKARDHDRAVYKRNCSIGLTVVGLLLGFGTLAVCIYYAVMSWSLVQEYFDNFGNNLPSA